MYACSVYVLRNVICLQRICSDPVMHERVLKSYELMLDFYGMKLKDRKTGKHLICEWCMLWWSYLYVLISDELHIKVIS